MIFQATFFDGRWRGHPDFLVRRDDRPSDLGDVRYDVADTKLAEAGQGGRHHPDVRLRATSSNGSRASRPRRSPSSRATAHRHAQRLADYAAYLPRREGSLRGPRSSRRRLPPETYPEPVDHCRVCSWWTLCIDRRRADDHLSLVANITRSNRRRLVDAGRRHARGACGPARPTRPSAKLPPRILDRLRRQAALQLGYRRDHAAPLRADPAGPRRARASGLAALPEPSRLDVFFDIEADPWARRRRARVPVRLGRDRSTASPRYEAIWAHDRAGRRQCSSVRRPRAGAARARPGDARLPLRRLRVGRAQAADAAPRDARGRESTSCSAAGRW